MVFEPWVFRFRVLSASFPNIAYFVFEFNGVFCFRVLSAINKRPFSRHDAHRVYYDYCALRQFVTVRGIVVS